VPSALAKRTISFSFYLSYSSSGYSNRPSLSCCTVAPKKCVAHSHTLDHPQQRRSTQCCVCYALVRNVTSCECKDSSQPVVLSSTKMSQLEPNRMQDNDGGLNMVSKNMSYTCPQTCSLMCAHDLTRFETSSVNKAKNMTKLSPQILSDIPHNSTFANGNANGEGILNSTTTTLPSNTNSTTVRALSFAPRASSPIVFS